MFAIFFSCMDTHHLLSLLLSTKRPNVWLTREEKEGFYIRNMFVHICLLVAFFVIAAMIQNVSTKQCPVTVQKTQTDGATEQLRVSHWRHITNKSSGGGRRHTPMNPFSHTHKLWADLWNFETVMGRNQRPVTKCVCARAACALVNHVGVFYRLKHEILWKPAEGNKKVDTKRAIQ